jgi:hypothetical protein
MTRTRLGRTLIWLTLVVLVLFPAACRRESRWDEADQASKGKRAVSEEAVPGSALNKFFPQSGDGAKVTYTQEKKGFAQADLNLDGQDVATLSISDTANNPSARDKFDGAETLGGYPKASVGSKGTAILVADRFQVQIRSEDAGFDRDTWLLEFDLAGLEGLK